MADKGVTLAPTDHFGKNAQIEVPRPPRKTKDGKPVAEDPKPIYSHARLRILAAIERMTNEQLKKAMADPGIAAAEARFHSLVQELSTRKSFNKYHDMAAGSLIAAHRNLGHAATASEYASTPALNKFHKLVGIGTSAERHVAQANRLIDLAHTFLVGGDHEHTKATGAPLSDFAKRGVPKSHALTSLIAGWNGDEGSGLAVRHGSYWHPATVSAPLGRPGTAAALVRVMQHHYATEMMGGHRQLMAHPKPAARPVTDAPPSLFQARPEPEADDESDGVDQGDQKRLIPRSGAPKPLSKLLHARPKLKFP